VEDLKKCYPENPAWVLGSRPCEAIAQAIFDYYKFETIVPSDANLMDGVVVKLLRRG